MYRIISLTKNPLKRRRFEKDGLERALLEVSDYEFGIKQRIFQFVKVQQGSERTLTDAMKREGFIVGYEVIKSKKGALESACWFWKTNGLNKWADKQDVVGMTKRINGGTIGLEDRKKHYKHALEVLGGSWSPPPFTHSTVKKGSKGETVKAVQRALGISADGDFGPGTEAAVIAWQKSRGLVPDGIVGKATLAAMGIK